MSKSLLTEVFEKLKNKNKSLENENKIIKNFINECNERLFSELLKNHNLIELLDKYRKCLIQCNNNCNCDQNINNKIQINCLENQYKQVFSDDKSEGSIDTNIKIENEFSDQNITNVEIEDNSEENINKMTINSSLNEKTLSNRNCRQMLSNAEKRGLDLVENNICPENEDNYNPNISCDSIDSSQNLIDFSKTTQNYCTVGQNINNKIFVCRNENVKYKYDYKGCGSEPKSRQRSAVNKVRNKVLEVSVCDWPECGYRSRYSHNVVRHKRKHTGEKPYICDYPECDKSYYRKDDLNSHINGFHKNQQNIECTFEGCEQRFTTKKYMKRHFERLHKNNY